MALDGVVGFQLNAMLTSALDLTTASSPLAYTRQLTYANGTGAAQADKMWSDQRTIGASGNDDLDLAGAALLDPFGAAVVFARVKGLVVYAASTNTNNVVVGGAGTNAFINAFGATTHTISVRPGGLLTLFATDATAYAVTATTGDLLRIANSSGGTSVIYDIVIMGASA